MEIFLKYSGIIAWIVFAFILFTQLIGKNILRKFAISIFFGKRLVSALKKLFKEYPNEIKKDTLAEVTGNVIYRFSRIGIIGLTITFFPIWLLMQQNTLIKSQNELFEYQNDKIENQTVLFKEQTQLFKKQSFRLDQQTNLLEAERRSSLVFLFSNTLDAIDRELKDDFNQDEKRNLSPQLIGRIVSLSHALKPYKYLENDSLINNPISPERGQLIILLLESKLSQNTYTDIFRKANFDYADFTSYDLSNYMNPNYWNHEVELNTVDLKELRLSNGDFSGVNLGGSDLRASFIRNSNFSNCQLSDIRFDGYLTRELRKSQIETPATLHNCNFENAEMLYSRCELTNFSKSNFNRAEVREVDFRYSNLDFCSFKETIIQGNNFNGASFKESNFNEAIVLNDNKFEEADLKNIILDSLYLESLESINLFGLKPTNFEIDTSKYKEIWEAACTSCDEIKLYLVKRKTTENNS